MCQQGIYDFFTDFISFIGFNPLLRNGVYLTSFVGEEEEGGGRG